MGTDQTTATWVFLMLTAVRRRLSMSSPAFVRLALRHDLMGFLFRNYELLHYYDNDYVVDEVLSYLPEQAEQGSGKGDTIVSA